MPTRRDRRKRRRLPVSSPSPKIVQCLVCNNESASAGAIGVVQYAKKRTRGVSGQTVGNGADLGLRRALVKVYEGFQPRRKKCSRVIGGRGIRFRPYLSPFMRSWLSFC